MRLKIEKNSYQARFFCRLKYAIIELMLWERLFRLKEESLVSLQFVLGPAKVDHRATMVDQLVTTLKDQPRDQFFYLVPNHIKFDT